MQQRDILVRAAPLYGGVLSSLGGMVWHRLCNIFRNMYYFAVTDEKLTEFRFHCASFVYVPEIDKENFLEPCEYNPKILIPTQERSLVLYQRDEALVDWDDEQLMFGMQEYDRRHGGDIGKLLEVADFYNRRSQLLKSWELSKDFDSEYS